MPIRKRLPQEAVFFYLFFYGILFELPSIQQTNSAMTTNSIFTKPTPLFKNEWILLPGLTIGLIIGIVFQGALGLTMGLGTAVLLSAVTMVMLGLRESKTLPQQIELYSLGDFNATWDSFLASLGNVNTNALVSLNRQSGKATLETRHSAVEISIQPLCPGECKVTLRAQGQENIVQRYLHGQALFLHIESELSASIQQLNTSRQNAFRHKAS